MNKLKQRYYGGDDNLFLHHSSKLLFKKLKKKFKEKDIKEFLQSQRYYSLYKQSTAKQNERNPYKIFTIDQLWEMDLISLPALSEFNSGITHLLVCIDTFSRFAFVRPLQSKQPREVVKALVHIFTTTQRKPHMIQTDAGKEFTGKVMEYFLKSQNIEFRVPKTTLPAKCAIVERFNRTLKQKISRYLIWKNITSQPKEKRYIDALQLIIDDYNNTQHSSTMMPPQSITTANSAQIYEKIRRRWIKVESKHPKLWEGSFVRVKRRRNLFEKESAKPIWSNEIFKIERVIPRKPYPVYEISDLKGRVVEGKLYERELQKIDLPNDTPIEIVKKPNLFDKTMRVKTIDGKIRPFDFQKEKNIHKENNYADVISLLK